MRKFEESGKFLAGQQRTPNPCRTNLPEKGRFQRILPREKFHHFSRRHDGNAVYAEMYEQHFMLKVIWGKHLLAVQIGIFSSTHTSFFCINCKGRRSLLVTDMFGYHIISTGQNFHQRMGDLGTSPTWFFEPWSKKKNKYIKD
jgi:hypothetical protein